MKSLLTSLTIVAAIGHVWATSEGGSGGALTNHYSCQTNLSAAIPDGDASGLAHSLVLAGANGAIADVNVTIQISGGFNGDLYAYLVHGSGFAVLLNRPGKTATDLFGYSHTGFGPESGPVPFTFDDQAANDVHLYQSAGFSLNEQQQVTGAWQPDGRATDPAWVLDTDSPTARLGTFQQLDPNGTWTLFIADLSSGAIATLEQWGLEITTVNQPPVAQGQTVTLAEDTSAAITLAGTDTENAALRFTVVATPTNGQLQGVAPNLTYTPATNYFGPDAFAFVVDDGVLTSAVAVVELNVTSVNDAPTAGNLSVSTDRNTPLAIDLAAADIEQDPLRFTIVAGPTNGVLTPGGGNRFTYGPNQSYVGPDAFTFVVDDGALTSAVAVVTIQVNAVYAPPVAYAVTNTSATEDATTIITLNGFTEGNYTLTYLLENAPRHGTVTNVGNQAFYTPDADFNGNDWFTYRVSDGISLSSVATVSVQVAYVNDVRPYAFTNGVDFPAGAGPLCVVAGDFKKNAKLDLAVVNADANTVSLLVGDGKGGFELDTNPPVSVGAHPVAAVAADFNKDTKWDLAVVNAGDNTVSVLTGDNAGGFALSATLSVGNDPQQAVAVDLNKDLRLDLAVANAQDHTVSLLFNLASGWSNGGTIAVGQAPRAIAAADLNKDLKQDLIVANSGSTNLSVFFGRGNGTFSNVVEYPTGLGPCALAVADVNGDKKPDVLVANWDSDDVTVLTNGVGGALGLVDHFGVGASLGFHPSSLGVADFNKDGKPDLVTTLAGLNAVEVMQGNGDGTFDFLWGDPASFYLVGGAPMALAVGDFNKDMAVDVVSANYASNNVTVLLNNYTPLAYKMTVAAREDTPQPLTLLGTYGPLDYVIVRGPTNGTMTTEQPLLTNGNAITVATNSTGPAVLTYTPKADAFGSDLIDYYVSDSVKSSKIARVTIKIAPVNDQPSFTLAANELVVGEDCGTYRYTNFAVNVVKGPSNEVGQSFKFIVTVTNEQRPLFSGVKLDTNGVYKGVGLPAINAKGVLQFTPAKNASGSTLVEVVLEDGGGVLNGGTNRSVVQRFTLTITNINDPPTITKPMGKTILEGGTAFFQVTVGDRETPAADLAVTVTSTNLALVPEGGTNVVVEVNPTNSAMRDITVYPVADQYGKTLLTFTVGDGTNGASAAALLTVNGVNDQPSFSLVTNLVVAPNNAGYTNPIIATAFAGANEGTQTLKYYITNAAPGLFAAQPAISPAGVLTFKPKGGTDVGPATLTVVVKDSGGVLNNGKDLSESQQLTIQLVAP